MKKLLACMLGFMGIILVNLNRLDLSVNLLGDGLVLLAAFVYSISAAMVKEYSKYENPIVLNGYQLMLGGIFMIGVGLLSGGRVNLMTRTGVMVLLYLAFLSAASYSLWGVLLKYNPVSGVAIYGFMTPIFGVILSFFMLNEQSGASLIRIVLSLLLITIGIIMWHYKKAEKNRKG